MVSMKQIRDRANSKTRRKICPVCHKNDNVIPVEYGFPMADPSEPLHYGRKEEVHLGGCGVGDNDPRWYCKRDNRMF